MVSPTSTIVQWASEETRSILKRTAKAFSRLCQGFLLRYRADEDPDRPHGRRNPLLAIYRYPTIRSKFPKTH
jgi:hypothetical protein